MFDIIVGANILEQVSAVRPCEQIPYVSPGVLAWNSFEPPSSIKRDEEVIGSCGECRTNSLGHSVPLGTRD